MKKEFPGQDKVVFIEVQKKRPEPLLPAAELFADEVCE